jgi:hypothetical protein
LRKLALLAPIFALLFTCHFAAAQQGDIMFFGGTLLSSSPSASDLLSGNIAEKGGTYLGVSGDVVGFGHRLGFNIETSWRASQANYLNQDVNYRPILTDFNALFQPKLGKRIGADLFGGIGIASTRFYFPYVTGGNPYTGYSNYTTSDHFMEDLGGGIRYYVWHHFFVRPEIHYYHIQNNTSSSSSGAGFSSGNVFRVGASIGYTIGND